MQFSGSIASFSIELKVLITSFLIVLSIGYTTGLLFVGDTSSVDPDGIEEQYLGNEDDLEAEVMKFKKSEREMLTIIHTHILSMALIFFLVSVLLCTTDINKGLKLFLIIEPFVSIVLTFGGLYLLWIGWNWMKYVVMISGTLMTISYFSAVGIIFRQLFFSKKPKHLI